MFEPSNYTFDVFENVGRGAIVGMVSATDQDEGSNAIVEYMLDNAFIVPFVVDDNSGNISVDESLNRENRSNYILIVHI